jgi:bacillithiol biosynthesis cysteine-adding enzyme BshC
MNVECSCLPVTPYLQVYTNEFEKVASLYSYDPRNPDDWKARADELASRFADKSYRNQLADALYRYNSKLGVGEKGLAAIEQIRQGALAIVTGQQAGLLSGPLYTIYKAITAVLLADEYQSSLRIPVVPVFWIAAEDHDFLEVNHAYILASDWTVKRLQLHGREGQRHSVGRIRVERDELERLVTEIESSTNPTEFRDACLQTLRHTWESTDNMADWFGALMANWFANTNLLFVNPIIPEFRQLTGHVFIHAIEANEHLRQAAQDGAKAVAACGFEPQVRIMPGGTLLFLQTDEGRIPLDVQDDLFHARGLDQTFTKQQLIDLARKHPERMSSNVLLRPIVQDYLLPTLAYVGGGAEVAYHGMLKPVFAQFGIRMPLIVPRISATIVEKTIAKAVHKYDLQLDAFLSDPHALQTFLRTLDEIGVDQTFADFLEHVDHLYDGLTDTLAKIDPQLRELAKENNQWVRECIQSLHHKALQYHEQKHEIAVRQVKKVLTSLKPENHMQERVYTILPYLIKYGPSFMEQLLRVFPSGRHANYYLYL